MLGLLTACGGGGGGGGVGATSAVLQALMLGSQESTVIDPDARACAIVQIASDGSVEFAGTGEATWTGDVTGLHIHRGTAGSDGPIVVDLLAAAAGGFDPTTHTASGSGVIGSSLASEIIGTPSNFYVNVHTTAAPNGLARGQLGAFTGLEIHAALNGAEHVPAVDPLSRGAATLQIEADRDVNWMVVMERPVITDVMMAHLHVGGPGVNGAIVIGLHVPGGPTGTLDPSTGILSGQVSTSFSMISQLCQDVDAFYVNVHTDVAPNGVARGQTSTDAVEFWAILKGNLETAVIDPTARGGMTLQLLSFTAGRAHLATPPDGQVAAGQGIDSLVGAHVHEGVAGVNGNILIDLQAGADYAFATTTGSAEGEVALTQALFTRILSTPSEFYANFHTAAAPNGLVRGQLTQDSVRFAADLLGTNEVPIANPSASGKLESLLVTSTTEASFSIRMTTPPAAQITAAHIHDGVAGVNGPILIDLSGAPNFQVSGAFLTGDTTFGGQTFARLMAFPEGFYCNVHTALAPAGVARGQLQRIADDIPPLALIYTTPVTYQTGAAITANVPSNSGGTITTYSVSPALPAGLVLNATTGVISGTPTVVSAAANYTVTGTNQAGFTTSVVNITIAEGPPTNLTYNTPVTYVKDTAITPNNPNSTGGTITNYSVSPALPTGLVLNASTGVISGTPTVVSAAANYTVTGSNGAGSVQATVNITVAASLQPPTNLSYTTPVSYSNSGNPITPNNPTVTGQVDSYSVNPTLPTGLSLHPTTGVISGTPTTVQSAANYTVTATNAAGFTTAVVNITITLAAPANLTYNPDPGVAYINAGTFSTMSPSSTGGAVASYALVNPTGTNNLPGGLTLNTSTGVISGACNNGTVGNWTPTIRATNATGSTDKQVTIIVYQ